MIYLLSPSMDFSFAKKFYGLDEILTCPSLSDILEKDRKKRVAFRECREIEEELLRMNYPLVEIDEKGEKFHPSFKMRKLPIHFFKRDAMEVAIELLGKIIVKEENGNLLAGKIVETEAYYGDRDPASRAYKGKKKYNRGMWLPGGHIFIYMVHANWMFNITTDDDEAEAVLIRAVEPIMGLKYMYYRRNRKIRELCNGPGKWTRAFGIERDRNEKPLGDEIYIIDSPWKNLEIKKSHRIGVVADLDEPLRFFIPSKFTSTNRIL